MSPRLLAIENEDMIFISILFAIILYRLIQSQLGPTKQERDRLAELFSIPQKGSRHDDAQPRMQVKSPKLSERLNNVGAVVLWASQGGTAETLASRYASELATTFSMKCITADLSDYEHQDWPDIPSQTFLVFIVSTFGEGNPPDNGVTFLECLRELRDKGTKLTNIRYTMFGLGNSNYTHYNKYALDINSLLLYMGATLVGSIGLGDDRNGGTMEDFQDWQTDMDLQIAKFSNIQPIKRTYAPRIRICPWKGSRDDLGSATMMNLDPRESQALSATNSGRYVMLPLKWACPLVTAPGNASKYSRDCVHLEFSLEDHSHINYETGDYVCILPSNPQHEIEALLKVLKCWEARHDMIEIQMGDNVPQSVRQVPTPTTLDDLFRYYLDICGPVSRKFIRGLAEFVNEESMKAFLADLTSDRDVFYSQVTSRKLTLAAVLSATIESQSGTRQLPPSAIPLSYIIESLRGLKPRSYSISSSAIVEPRVVAVAALALREEFSAPPSSWAKEFLFHGVASNYLLQLQRSFQGDTNCASAGKGRYQSCGPKVLARIRQSNFKAPKDPSTPMIMIGTGTGVAPFRAFVQERMKLKLSGVEVGKTIVLVGHRSPDCDFYYKDVWEEAQIVLGGAFELWTAFSRDNNHPRSYVQDVVASNSSLVLQILHDSQSKPGAMYICGSTHMAKGVRNRLVEIRTEANPGEETYSARTSSSDNWLADLIRQGRLHEDSWG